MSEVIQNPNETSEIQRGNEAKFLMEHPMLVAALDALEKSYEHQWKTTQLKDRDEREEAFRMMHTVQLFKTLLTRYIETGTLAEKQKYDRAEQERLAAVE